MSSLVGHQSVDEPRDLDLENKMQQESSRSCSKLSTSVEDDACQEKLLTAETTVLSMDRSIDPEHTHVHDEHQDLVTERAEDDVLDIIYEGKRSRPPDVVDNNRTKSNVDSCTSPSASLMHLEAWVADKVKAPREPQDGTSECVLVPERQDPVVTPEDDDVIDIVLQEKPDPPPNLEPRNTDRGSRASEMPMHLEARAITDTTDLAIEQGFDGQVYVARRGKCGRPPDFTQEIQVDDEYSRHFKFQASEWAPNDKYRSTAPSTSYEELEELPPSRFLKYLDNHRPVSPPEMPRQDKVFLAENPEYLAVEQGKRGGDDGEIKTNLQVPRNDDSSTISNSYLKLSESIQLDVTQATRTYVPCNVDSRTENDGNDHRSTSVRGTTNPASESSPLVSRRGVYVPTGPACGNEQEKTAPPPTRGLVGRGCVDMVECVQPSMTSDDALSLLRNDETHHLVPPMDKALMNLAIEHGSDIAAATQENQNMASSDAPKTLNDEHIRRPRLFDGHGYVVQRGKRGRPPDRMHSDKHSHHFKSHASEWAPNDRYRSTAPLTGYEELKELLSLENLECPENRYPGNLMEISHQDRASLAENPTCLAVEQSKRGGDDGKFKINLQLLRKDHSSTIMNSYSKSFESIQLSIAQTGARTYVPCTADLRIENDDPDHCSIDVQRPVDSASESSSLVNGRGVTAPAGSACSNERGMASPLPPTRGLVGRGCANVVEYVQLSMASSDAPPVSGNDKTRHLVPASENVPPIDEVPTNLTVERSGSDVATATHENRDVALLDALKTVDDEHIRRHGPVEDTVHQGDAPHVKKRKGLVIRRGTMKKTNTKRDKRQGTFAQTIAGAETAPASHLEGMKSLVIGQGITGEIATNRSERLGTFVRATDGPNAGGSPTERDERQETFTQVVADENDAPGPNIKRNECPEAFARSVVGARGTPASHAEDVKNLVIGQGVGRNAGVEGNEHQQMFARDVASADYAQALRCPLPESKSIEETYSSARQVSKRRATLAALPPVVQTNYLPSFHAQTSSKTCQYPSRGYEPSLTSASPKPVESQRRRWLSGMTRRQDDVVVCERINSDVSDEARLGVLPCQAYSHRKGPYSPESAQNKHNSRTHHSCDESQGQRIEAMKALVVEWVSARGNVIGMNERQWTFVRAAAGADVAPASHRPWPTLNDIETTKELVVGRVPEKESGDRRNERQRTFARAVAGAEGAPAPHRSPQASTNFDERRSPTRTCGKENERQRTFVRDATGAESAPAHRRSWQVSRNANTTKWFVVGLVSARRNGAGKDERQETFACAVADANSALARRGALRVLKDVEEIYFSTKNVSKRWAALVTLPPIVQMDYLPDTQTQTSSKAHQCPPGGRSPSLTSASRKPVDSQRMCWLSEMERHQDDAYICKWIKSVSNETRQLVLSWQFYCQRKGLYSPELTPNELNTTVHHSCDEPQGQQMAVAIGERGDVGTSPHSLGNPSFPEESMSSGKPLWPALNDIQRTTEFVIGRILRRGNGTHGDERQRTFAQGIPGAEVAPAAAATLEHRLLLIKNISKPQAASSTLPTVVLTNYSPFHQVQTSLKACLYPSPMPSWALDTVETMRLVIGPVSVRRIGAGKNERHGTFARTEAGTSCAPAHHSVLQTLRNVEETCSSTKKISKRRAASSTLPTVTQMSYTPGFQAQTSSEARQCPSRGYSPSIPSSLSSPIIGWPMPALGRQYEMLSR
jgi:hypothetical protein